MSDRKQPISRSDDKADKPVLIVAGPTASGKSSLAMASTPIFEIRL